MRVIKPCCADLEENVKIDWALPRAKSGSAFSITGPTHIVPSFPLNIKTPIIFGTGNNPKVFKTIFCFRRAIRERAFETIDPIVARQIRTNLANRLHALGRPVAANEERLRVLKYDPLFAKALAGQARGITFYARQLYDNNHIPILLAAARSLFDAALGKDAFWESDDRDSFTLGLTEERNRIADDLLRNHYDEDYDTNQWSLGATEEERVISSLVLEQPTIFESTKRGIYRKCCCDRRVTPAKPYLRDQRCSTVPGLLQSDETGICQRPVPVVQRDAGR